VSRTPADIVTAVRGNLMDAGANSEVSARVVEFLARAQNELEDARFSPAQHGIVSGTPTSLSSVVASKPADWIGIRIDTSVDPVVAPHYLTGDGEVKYLLPPYFTDQPEVIRQRYGYADNPLTHSAVMTFGAPQIIALDETGVLDPAGTTTARLRCYPHTDGLNTSGVFVATGLYPVRIPYWKRLTAFDGATENWFTQNCDYYLEWAATFHGLIANRDLSAAAPYVTQAAGELERLRAVAREGRTPRSFIVRGHGYALGTPSLRQRRIHFEDR
jgi:hypothetical protein